jgi:type I restriction-modification system DNA methylase subunit
MAEATFSDAAGAFALEVGKDVKDLYTLITGAANIVSLVNLKTATKANLVAALNEVFDLANAAANSGGAVIDDNVSRTSTTYSSSKIEQTATAKALAIVSDGTTATTTTWSSSKINAAIGNLTTQLQNILNLSPEAYDSFKEVADYIESDKTGAAAMTASIQNRIRVDADQSFTSAQITQGLANLVKLGVAKQADLSLLITRIGDTTVDLKGIYLAARNS